MRSVGPAFPVPPDPASLKPELEAFVSELYAAKSHWCEPPVDTSADDAMHRAPRDRLKPLNRLGGVQAIGRRYRAWMNVLGRREWGPTRAFERKATADMALMRAAATPEAVRTIAGRLRAEATVGTIAGGCLPEAAAQRRAVFEAARNAALSFAAVSCAKNAT